MNTSITAKTEKPVLPEGYVWGDWFDGSTYPDIRSTSHPHKWLHTVDYDRGNDIFYISSSDRRVLVRFPEGTHIQEAVNFFATMAYLGELG